jgi:hypothetical protein
MTRAEALEILQLPSHADADEIEDALDDQLFAMRKEAMTKYMVPQLLDKLVRRADLLAECSEVMLGAPWTPQTAVQFSDLNTSDEIAFFQEFEKRESEMKLQLNSAKNALQLKRALQALQEHQRLYMKQFVAVFSRYKNELESPTNSREVLDTGKLLLLMKQGNHKEEIEYLLAKELSRVSQLV